MSDTTKVDTCNLSGVALDWAGAGLVHSEKWRHQNYEGGPRTAIYGFSPSTDPGQGFPILVENKVSLIYNEPGYYEAAVYESARLPGEPVHSHKNPLVAGLRAVVHYHLGSVVDIPSELTMEDIDHGT